MTVAHIDDLGRVVAFDAGADNAVGAGVDQGDNRQRGVPYGGLARFEAPAPFVVDDEPVEARQRGPDHRVVERVALEREGDDRIDDGGLDAAPQAVRLLPADDPLLGLDQRRLPYGAARGDPGGQAFVAVQGPVEGFEAPGRGPPPGPASGPPRTRSISRGLRRPQLVHGEGQRPGRPVGHDHGQGHDGLPGPAREVVHVERHPRGQEHDLRRDHGQVLPVPPPDDSQPDPGEHPAGFDAAPVPHPGRRQGHVGLFRAIAGQAERHVRLDGGRQVGRRPVERPPRPVRPLVAPNPARRLGGQARLEDSEEMPQEEVLGVHGHVGLELALPPAVGMLKRQQVVAGPLQGPNRVGLDARRVDPRPRRPGACVHRGVDQGCHDSRSTTYTAMSARSRWGIAESRTRSRAPRAASRLALARTAVHSRPPQASTR